MIDFRSDTVTKPTTAMLEAMFKAELGDDVYDDDPTTNELQALAANITGKEAALFVPTGTFGNQLCLFTHANRGDEVIVDDKAHIIQHETGAGAVIAGVQFRTFESPDGQINPYDIARRIRLYEDIHEPKTALICLENARSDGRVLSIETMREVRKISNKYDIPVHIDGARIFNAVSYLGIDVKELAGYYDSMSFCLSKGLCAPVGSIVVGTNGFIKKAKKKRKLMGGGMRQTGVLAAAGIVALKEMAGRLGQDNENAIYLAERLSEIPCIELVNKEAIHINMVFFKVSVQMDFKDFVASMREVGIVVSEDEGEEIRFVTHYWISRADIDYTVEQMKKYFSQKQTV